MTLYSFLEAPILNPCFVIENWALIGSLRLKIAGQIVPNGANFKFDIEKNVGETQYLVVWRRKKSTSQVSVVIEKKLQPNVTRN